MNYERLQIEQMAMAQIWPQFQLLKSENEYKKRVSLIGEAEGSKDLAVILGAV